MIFRLRQQLLNEWFRSLLTALPVVSPSDLLFMDDDWVIGEEFHMESIEDALRDPAQARLAVEVLKWLGIYRALMQDGYRLVRDSKLEVEGISKNLGRVIFEASRDEGDALLLESDPAWAHDVRNAVTSVVDAHLSDTAHRPIGFSTDWVRTTVPRPSWLLNRVFPCAVAVAAAACLVFVLAVQTDDSTPARAEVPALPLSAETFDLCTGDIAPGEPAAGVAAGAEPVAGREPMFRERTTAFRTSRVKLGDDQPLLIDRNDRRPVTVTVTESASAVKRAAYRVQPEPDEAIEVTTENNMRFLIQDMATVNKEGSW